MTCNPALGWYPAAHLAVAFGRGAGGSVAQAVRRHYGRCCLWRWLFGAAALPRPRLHVRARDARVQKGGCRRSSKRRGGGRLPRLPQQTRAWPVPREQQGMCGAWASLCRGGGAVYGEPVLLCVCVPRLQYVSPSPLAGFVLPSLTGEGQFPPAGAGRTPPYPTTAVTRSRCRWRYRCAGGGACGLPALP